MKSKSFEWISRSPEETRRLGISFGKALKPGQVACLSGQLGSGKTTFVQGVARGAGFKGRVLSPTFGIVREYRTKKLTIYHLDLFRLEPRDIANIGLEEYLQDPRGACLIEWPGAGKARWPEDHFELKFSHAGDGVRRLLARGLELKA